MKRILLGLVLIFQTSCLTRYHYNVVLQNVGSRDLEETTVNYGSFQSGGGILIPRAKKVYLSPSHPIPARAYVIWRTPDGVLHNKEVEVKSRIPRNFKGDIYFKIDDRNNVTVEASPDK